MTDINDIHKLLWHIKTGIAVLVWEFIITINCIFIQFDKTWWYILTVFTLIVWIIAIAIHMHTEDKRRDDEIKARMDDEESGRRW